MGGKGKRGSPRMITAAVAALCVVAVLAKIYWPKPSLQEVGEAALSCIVSGEVGCLAQYSLAEEADRLSYDDGILNAYHEQFLRPAFAGLKPVAGYEVLTTVDRGWVTVFRNYVTANGSVVPLSIRIVNTTDGPKAPCLVFGTFQLAAHRGRHLALSEKMGRVDSIIRTAREKGPMLEALGLKGVWRDSPDQVLTWEELAVENEEPLKKMKAALEAQRQSPPTSSLSGR